MRKKKEAVSTTITDLTDDHLLEILKKLPPDILRYKIRFVCRLWFDLITDSILLNHASLIIENRFGYQTARLVDIKVENQGLIMKEQNLRIPYDARIGSICIKGWCNELLLVTDRNKSGHLYIFNQITKDGSFLPPCSTPCGAHMSCDCGLGLSYDEFKKVYKVVHVVMGPRMQSELITLKRNTESWDFSDWKKINGPSYTGRIKDYWGNPISVEGRYFHWNVYCPKYLVSMDTVKERFRQTCLPASDVYPMSSNYSLFEMDGFLALLHKASMNQVHIWMLKDFHRTKWELLQSISTSFFVGRRSFYGSIPPSLVNSVRGKRYLILRKYESENGLYSYDLITKVKKRLRLKIAPDEHCVVESMASSV